MSAWGKLQSAALELSKGTPIKQRLTVTFSKHLTQIEPAELPPAMRAELRTLLASFEAVTPLRGETAAHATIRKMSIEQAEALAARIVTLFGQVARLSSPRPVEDSDYGAAEASSGGAEVLPLFAAEA